MDGLVCFAVLLHLANVKEQLLQPPDRQVATPMCELHRESRPSSEPQMLQIRLPLQNKPGPVTKQSLISFAPYREEGIFCCLFPAAQPSFTFFLLMS